MSKKIKKPKTEKEAMEDLNKIIDFIDYIDTIDVEKTNIKQLEKDINIFEQEIVQKYKKLSNKPSHKNLDTKE